MVSLYSTIKMMHGPINIRFASVGPLEMSTRTHEGLPVICLLPLSTLGTKDTEHRSPQKCIQQFSCCQAHFCIFWSQTRKNNNIRKYSNTATWDKHKDILVTTFCHVRHWSLCHPPKFNQPPNNRLRISKTLQLAPN